MNKIKLYVATVGDETKIFANYADAVTISRTRRGAKAATNMQIDAEHVGRLYGTNCMPPESELGDAIHDVTRDIRRLGITL